MKEKKPLLGVLGGLGPMASAYFYELLTERTNASCDQEHIDAVVCSRASTPDRSAYLMGKSQESPLPKICADAQRLEQFGADLIVITCNTSHCFIEDIRKSVGVPVPSIIEETVKFLRLAGCKKAGIMATDGTVATNLYQKELEKAGIEYALPDGEYQKTVMSLIYDDVKSGKEPSREKFYSVAEHLKNKGCERIILGCTELSVINTKLGGESYFCDAMEVLSYRAICLCGGKPKGFPREFELMRNEAL